MVVLKRRVGEAGGDARGVCAHPLRCFRSEAATEPATSWCPREAVVAAFRPSYHMFGLSQTEKLKKRVEECEETLRRIEHAFKMLEVQWTETYDKFRTLNWRVAKRVRALEGLENDSAKAEETPHGGEDAASGAASAFSPSQQKAQQQVLARRSRNRVNGGE